MNDFLSNAVLFGFLATLVISFCAGLGVMAMMLHVETVYVCDSKYAVNGLILRLQRRINRYRQACLLLLIALAGLVGHELWRVWQWL